MRPVQRHTQASASTRGSVYSVFLSLENGALPVKPEFIRGGMNFLSSHLEEISQETLDYSFSTNLGEKNPYAFECPLPQCQKANTLMWGSWRFLKWCLASELHSYSWGSYSTWEESPSTLIQYYPQPTPGSLQPWWNLNPAAHGLWPHSSLTGLLHPLSHSRKAPSPIPFKMMVYTFS